MPKYPWSEWEKKVAFITNGKITPGSGNKWYAKSDVRTAEYRISCKQTANDSFSVTRSDWREIQKIAMQDGVAPVLAIDMNGIQMAVVDWDDFINLCSLAHGKEYG